MNRTNKETLKYILDIVMTLVIADDFDDITEEVADKRLKIIKEIIEHRDLIKE